MSLRHALLGLLNQRPASGYDLLGQFQMSLANVWPATQSQLYTELNKLTDQGMLTVSAEGSRGRKEYAITDAGRVELRHWLIEIPPNHVRRSDSLLRVFFLNAVARDEAVGYLRGFGEQASTEQEEYRQIDKAVDWNAGPLATYGRIAFEYGVRLAAMEREWAEWAATYLTEESGTD